MPLPQLDPMDVITFVKGTSNILCPVTDITFKLSGMTTLGCKSDQLAHGRSYGLQDATFYAHNIAANAVTADKISVDDLAALRATIAGWNIGADALYQEVTSGGYTYRVELCAPANLTPNTQAITVKRKATGSSTWEAVDTTTYGGQHTAKDFIANGRVLIAPDYDLQEAGVYAIDLEQNGAELYANPNFLNIEEGGSQTHLDSTVISSTASDDTMLRMENYGADYAEFRATQGEWGQSSYREGALSPKEVRFSKTNSTASAHMNADEVEVGNSKMENGSFTSDDGRYRASMWTNGAGGFFEVYDGTSGKSSMLSMTELTVNDRDILRTHQSLVGGWGTAIPANANLNTTTYCAVGRYSCVQSARAASLSNCPTSIAFCMWVEAPIEQVLDNETTTTWQYRVRYIEDVLGNKWTQMCNSNSNKAWTYHEWEVVATDRCRTLQSMVGGWGVYKAITSNANLNATDGSWCKIGRYSCTTAVAGTLTNSPYNMEFTMTVRTITGAAIDDESGTWKYRLREIESYNGYKWVQHCWTAGTAGSWQFNPWMAVPYAQMWKDRYSNTNIKNGECVARRNGQTVYINCDGDAKSIAAGTVTDYVTLGSQYRPSETIRCAIQNKGEYNSVQFAIINTNGKVQLYSSVAISSATNFAFHVTYIVD
jgi:hypothetical protein